jgi:Nitrile hydratase, alpha chain
MERTTAMSTPTTPEQVQQAAQQLIARCWADAEFKARLMADPTGTLKAEGYPVPEGHVIQVVESTASQNYFVIPPAPTAELSDETLDQVAGGLNTFCTACISCNPGACF